MGQYYKVALIQQQNVKIIQPEGWKLMEHSYYGNLSMKRIEYLLYKNTTQVMRIGDYSQVAPFVWTYKWEDEEDMWRRDEKDVDWLLEHDENYYYYLVNSDTKEFINLTDQEKDKDLVDEYWLTVHPLPLLCRAETEEAWWDYHSYFWKKYIWIWCWDRLYIDRSVERLEDNYKEAWLQNRTFNYMFKE